MTGALLALATWTAGLLVVVMIGLPWTIASDSSARPRITLKSLRSALWVGLGIAVAVILFTNLFVPLRSGTATFLGLGVLLVSGLALAIRRPGFRLCLCRSSAPAWLITAGALIAIVYFAVVAMGPVTNYDSGLYHIGAVRYAGDFATIPGLANVYQAFGYNNSQFPLAAAFTNGPWGVQGLRLVNGFLIMLVCVELALRWWGRRRGHSAYVLLIGAACLLIPMVALADYWVTSPTSDPAVFVLCIVALTYLSDVVLRPKVSATALGVTIVVSALTVTMRPTMIFFAATVVTVAVIATLIRRRAFAAGGRSVLWSGVLIALALFGLQVTRDRLLSGWLMYPLSIHAFDVPWRALDPVNTRTATLGAARDPANYLEAAQGWTWVGSWTRQLPSNWEFLAVITMALVVLFLVLVRRAQGQRTLWSPKLAAVVAPSLVAVLTWWLMSPPTFRFIWGPLFGLLVIPIGWLLTGVVRRGSKPLAVATTTAGIALLGLVVLVSFTLITRVEWSRFSEAQIFELGSLRVTYLASEIPAPVTEDVPMPSGLVLKRPVPSDQCWMDYPLCTPLIEAEVVPRGSPADLPGSIGDGFTHRP